MGEIPPRLGSSGLPATPTAPPKPPAAPPAPGAAAKPPSTAPADQRATSAGALAREQAGPTGDVPVPLPPTAPARPPLSDQVPRRTEGGTTPETLADWDNLVLHPMDTATRQGGLAGAQMEDAVRRYKAEPGAPPLKSGAEAYDLPRLNQWMSQNGCYQTPEMRKAFTTGQEKALFDAIQKAGDGPPERRLEMGEIMAIALKLNKGDVTKALLTTHNMLRAVARPNLESETHWDIAEKFWTGSEATKQNLGENWMRRYLDGNSAGMRDPVPGERIADDWYHTFVSATVQYVGDQRGTAQVAADQAQLPAGWGGAWAQTVMASLAITKPGTSLAVLNTMAEQGVYGVLTGLFRKDGADEVHGVEPGEVFAGMRGAGIADGLARETR